MSNCPICNSEAMSRSLGGVDGEEISCPRCGEYQISRTAAVNWRSVLKEGGRQIANASGWIREHQKELITSATIETLEALNSPSVIEKANRLLKVLVKESEYFGFKVTIDKTDVLYGNMNTADRLASMRLVGEAWALHGEELSQLLSYLEEEQLISKKAPAPYVIVTVTAKGFAYIERLSFTVAESELGFCAMWFDDSVKPIWTQAILPAMSDAGYEPKRIDEHHHNNRIDDEIIALIRRSKFVVADFTGQRGGVYFEAGFALGMNLPVIWTVKKSELSEVHFDNRQYNFVVWEDGNLPEFKLNLQYRIEATLGRGTWMPDA